MKDSTLIKSSLIASVAGLFVLCMFSYYDSLKVSNEGVLFPQSGAKDSASGSFVHVNGTIVKVIQGKKTTSAMVESCAIVEAVIFDTIPLDVKQKVAIIGKTQWEKGKMKVIADEVKYI